jgi:hypothetical protein
MAGDLSDFEAPHPVDDSIKMLGDSNFSSRYGFGSTHEDVVNFVLLDASVRAIRRTCDPVVLFQLAGRMDGGIPEGF